MENYWLSRPDDFRIFDEVDINYEPTAYCLALEAANPIIRFKKVKSFDTFELVTNVLGSYERMAFALGCEVGNLYERWNDIISNSGDVSICDSKKAPVKEMILSGDGVDLSKIPAPKHFVSDGSNAGFGNYVSSGIVVARDPTDCKTINLSFSRMQIIGKAKFAFDVGSGGHFSTYIEKARKLGASLPVSIIIGAHPLYYMLAASFMENEYSKAAKVLDSEYVFGEANQDIPIPRDSEIVIEAEVALNEFFDEGPFAEFTGYTVDASTRNVAHAKSVLRKYRPIYYDITPSNSNEHVGLFSMPRNVAVTKAIKQFMPPGIEYSIEWPKSAAHFLALCTINKPVPGLAKQLGVAILGLDPLFTREIVVNEGETRLDLEHMLANLALEGARKGVNVDIIPLLHSIKLDRTLMPSDSVGKMIIVTKNQPAKYWKLAQGEHEVRFVVSDHSSSEMVVFSRERVGSAKVNVVLDYDIDLSNSAQLAWAFGTRVVPDRDVEIDEVSGRITIWARKKELKIPAIPESVAKRVASVVGKHSAA